MYIDEQEPSPEYLKGFNSGYLLSKHDPELLDKLLKSQSGDSEYIHAMNMGKKQHDREKLLSQIKDVQQRDRDKSR